jgi:hypothetical protein
MASKEQIVLWRDGEGVAGKDARVHSESDGHAAGDAVGSLAMRMPQKKKWRGEERSAYISASFCVSITAAIGMPKFDAGPQKSVQ